MGRTTVWILLLCLSLFRPSAADAQESTEAPAAQESSSDSEGKSLGHRLLFWIPNRVFDVLDVARLRLRVGPGLTISARATEFVDVNLGGHATIFAGLHGPRSEPQIPWPLGFETYAGAEVSVASAGTDESRTGPQYGPTEIGVGTQLLFLGFDVGIEPYDVLDFVLGLLTLDPKGDDF